MARASSHSTLVIIEMTHKIDLKKRLLVKGEYKNVVMDTHAKIDKYTCAKK
jgi:hypothetical protein